MRCVQFTWKLNNIIIYFECRNRFSMFFYRGTDVSFIIKIMQDKISLCKRLPPKRMRRKTFRAVWRKSTVHQCRLNSASECRWNKAHIKEEQDPGEVGRAFQWCTKPGHLLSTTRLLNDCCKFQWTSQSLSPQSRGKFR